MGTSLSGLTPQNTYTGLLKFGDNSAISASLKYVSDGAGNDTLLAMSTTALNIGANNLSARLGIKGSGSTSATTSLLVQNSAGTQLFKIADDGTTTLTVPKLTFGNTILAPDAKIGITPYSAAIGTLFNSTTTNGGIYLPVTFWVSHFYCEVENGMQIGSTTGSYSASAKLQVDSTTKGFLPPRMTTTQKNAIATPASGLVVYDSTTNKLCCYNGSTWNDLF